MLTIWALSIFNISKIIWYKYWTLWKLYQWKYLMIPLRLVEICLVWSYEMNICGVKVYNLSLFMSPSLQNNSCARKVEYHIFGYNIHLPVTIRMVWSLKDASSGYLFYDIRSWNYLELGTFTLDKLDACGKLNMMLFCCYRCSEPGYTVG